MSDTMIRVIAVAFAIGGWMYGGKRGYTHRGKSFMALLGVVLWVVLAAVFFATFAPESVP